MTGSNSDDWIYWHFTVAHKLGYSVSTSRLLVTDLNTKNALQLTIKSSCYFFFNHSVLLCPNLYSINLHNSLTAPYWTAVCRCIHIPLTELWSTMTQFSNSISSLIVANTFSFYRLSSLVCYRLSSYTRRLRMDRIENTSSAVLLRRNVYRSVA
jgi:hypothetical protein